MQYKYCFTNIHRTLTNLLNNDFFYEKILIIFEKNFVQILLIVKKNTRNIIINANIQRLFFESYYRFLYLRINMRVRHDVAN